MIIAQFRHKFSCQVNHPNEFIILLHKVQCKQYNSNKNIKFKDNKIQLLVIKSSNLRINL